MAVLQMQNSQILALHSILKMNQKHKKKKEMEEDQQMAQNL